MKVKELIERLAEQDQDLEVVGYNGITEDDFFVEGVTTSEVTDDDYPSLKGFYTQGGSVCEDSPAGEKFVVIFTEK